MSWLVNSIANSLKLENDDSDEEATKTTVSAGDGKQQSPSSPSNNGSPRRGVQEDLSGFSKTLTRQFWGVASFLAPPPSYSQICDPDPQSSDRSEIFDQDDSGSAGIVGIRSDLSEIGGRFRTGISKLSSNKALSEFTKIASDFIQFVSEEGETLEDYAQRGVIGVTEEVVAFARDVAMHPETWLDFPLPDEDEEEDFDMSDIQQEHALAVERLARTLAALRMELCPGCMSERRFWKIYFVLVHPRLTKHDAELLSNYQVMSAREMLTQGIRTCHESKPDRSGRVIDTVASEAANSKSEEHLSVPSDNNADSLPVNVAVIVQDTSLDTANAVVDKHPLASTEIPVTQEVHTPRDNNGRSLSDVSKGVEENCDEDGDEWLKEELPERGNSSGTAIPIEDDDISFSDLEEEDEEMPIKYKKVVSASESSTTGGPKHEAKDSNDWLDIEDIDAA